MFKYFENCYYIFSIKFMEHGTKDITKKIFFSHLKHVDCSPLTRKSNIPNKALYIYDMYKFKKKGIDINK